MKKIVGIIAVIVIIMAGACYFLSTNQKKATQANTTANSSQISQSNASGSSKQRNWQRPGEALLAGEVTSIVGNEVSLKMIETPKFTGNPGQGQNGQHRQWNGGQGGNQGNGQNGMRRALKYTGETKDFTIPVGVPISTMLRTDSGREMKDVQFNEIKKGDILQIWYADKNYQKIARIQLRSSGGTGGSNGTNS